MIELCACSGDQVNNPLRQDELLIGKLFDLCVVFFDGLVNGSVLWVWRSTGGGSTGVADVSRSVFGSFLLEFWEEGVRYSSGEEVVGGVP